jgi:glycerol uptake facilitator-like aquaporin
VDDETTVDVEPLGEYVKSMQEVSLESEEAYVRRVTADVTRSKATAAIWVTIILSVGLVVSLPFYALTVIFIEPDRTEVVANVFGEWYRVVSPVLAAAVGALLGVSLASSSK